MKQNRLDWTIEEMARVLSISRSGYYRAIKNKCSKREQEKESLKSAIKRNYELSRQTYGSPRIHAALIAQGHVCSRQRVARLMRQMGIASKMKRLFRKRTTRVNPKQAIVPNRLGQNFRAERPNQKWVADISYVRTAEGWLYVAVVLDLFSRKVVGLSMANTLHTPLVINALEQGLKRRNPEAGLLHHSDRGCQYTSQAFQGLLDQQKIIGSMSAQGYCYDNAAMESFFHTLKTECVYFESYKSREEARESIFEYVEVFYNNHRSHSTLGYVSPVQFEERYFQQLCSSS